MAQLQTLIVAGSSGSPEVGRDEGTGSSPLALSRWQSRGLGTWLPAGGRGGAATPSPVSPSSALS